jgi:hypothetical protein
MRRHLIRTINLFFCLNLRNTATVKIIGSSFAEIVRHQEPLYSILQSYVGTPVEPPTLGKLAGFSFPHIKISLIHDWRNPEPTAVRYKGFQVNHLNHSALKARYLHINTKHLDKAKIHQRIPTYWLGSNQ